MVHLWIGRNAVSLVVQGVSPKEAGVTCAHRDERIVFPPSTRVPAWQRISASIPLPVLRSIARGLIGAAITFSFLVCFCSPWRFMGIPTQFEIETVCCFEIPWYHRYQVFSSTRSNSVRIVRSCVKLLLSLSLSGVYLGGWRYGEENLTSAS